MTPKWLKNAIRCWAVTLFLVVIFLLVWYLWELPKQQQNHTFGNDSMVVRLATDTSLTQKHKRQIGRIDHQKQCAVNRAKLPEIDYCTRPDQIPKVRFCFGSGSDLLFKIPFSTLKSLESSYDGNYYKGHEWYLAEDYVDSPSWGTVVAYTGNDWTPQPTTEMAKHHAKAFNLSTYSLNGQRLGLLLTMNEEFTGCWADDCWTMHLYPYVTGRDPPFILSLCKAYRNAITLPQITHPQAPEMSVGLFAKTNGAQIYTTQNMTTEQEITLLTGISGIANNWLLMVEQAANITKNDCVVCLGPRPILQVVPAIIPEQCVVEVMNSTTSNRSCNKWDFVFPVTTADKNKPIFSKKVAPGNFTCINMTGTGSFLGNRSQIACVKTISVPENFSPIVRADIWWWCGDNRLFDRLPRNVSALCALVTLLLPISIHQVTADSVVESATNDVPLFQNRRKRGTWQKDGDPTYIDAIGVPRGVPDEYKIADQIAGGFESLICWWCTINKNVDRINYIHYNVQRLGNWTQSGFEAVHNQLSATSLMAFQNRIAVDMLLAEKGGVCSMFGEQCCTFIPNNTAVDGSLTRAIEGLRTLNSKMKEHSGVDTSMWDSWMNVFGKYRALVASVIVSTAVFAAILTLCGCCCIPCLRSLVNRLITTAITPMENRMAQVYPLLADDCYFDDDDEDYELDR